MRTGDITEEPKTALILGGMPKKITPSSLFGKKLVLFCTEQKLTQTQLAEKIGSTQRAVSRYETIAELPPAHVIVKLAKALKVSADELLALRPLKPRPAPKEDPEERRLWKKFQLIRELPVKDQKAVIRLINSLVSSKKAS